MFVYIVGRLPESGQAKSTKLFWGLWPLARIHAVVSRERLPLAKYILPSCYYCLLLRQMGQSAKPLQGKNRQGVDSILGSVMNQEDLPVAPLFTFEISLFKFPVRSSAAGIAASESRC